MFLFQVTMAIDPASRPSIWAFSTSRLLHVFEAVAPTLADEFEVRVFEGGFEGALATVRELTQAGEQVDALVAAGANGAYLHDHADLPVVVVEASTVDALQGVIQARKLSKRIGVVNFRRIVAGLDEAKWLLGATDFEQRAYVTPEDARARVAELAAGGTEVIIGPGPVCALAEQAGLAAVLLYGQDSLVEAIRRAAEITAISRGEAARREALQRALDQLEPGLISVDVEERIVAVNGAVERLLGAGAAELLGKRLTSLSPALGLARTLATGRGGSR